MSIGAHVGRWTVLDVLALPEDAYRYEVMDGALIMSPPPTLEHQRITHRLHNLLEAATEQDVWEGVGVQLAPDRMVIPDLVVAKTGAVYKAAPTLLLAEEVDLVIEVVSPGSRARDRAEKPLVYAEADIRHFWRIETAPYPGNHRPLPVLLTFVLAGGQFDKAAEVGAGWTFETTSPFPVRFDPGVLTRPSG